MSNYIYALFTNPILGNKENAKHLSRDKLSLKLDPLIEQQLRLRFIVPSFPFKDQNIFRTEAPPGHVDLGEVATLVRLHTLALAMFQVHPFGADWIIISDGLAYAPILYVDINETLAYRQRLMEYRNLLNIQGTVSIIDLKDMTRRLYSRQAKFEIFVQTVDEICRVLVEMTKSQTGYIFESFRVLTRGMKWNINIKHLDHGLRRQDLWTIFNTELINDVSLPLRSTWQEIDALSVEAAYNYAAFNLALRYHSVFERLLPNSLRTTIHPKPGQLAVPRIGDVFPWNGVGVVRDLTFGPTSVETWPLYRLIRQYPDAIPHRLHGEGPPLYYLCPPKPK